MPRYLGTNEQMRIKISIKRIEIERKMTIIALILIGNKIF
jgi:hypothetical protein